jgi:hypothetical protein
MIFLVVLLGLLVGVTLDWEAVTKTGAKRDILTYVPADTVYFFGGVEPASFEDKTQVLDSFDWLKNIDWSVLDFDEAHIKKMPPAIKMIIGLYAEYIKIFEGVVDAPQKFGTGSELDSVLYAVGVMPVMRVRLENPQAFNTFLDTAEQYMHASAEKLVIDGVTFRSYSLDPQDTEQASGIKFIIGAHDNYGIFSLLSGIESDNARRMIAGAVKPKLSLVNVPTLDNIIKRYKFHPAYLGYFNHKAIIDGITDPQQNEFGKMLDAILSKEVRFPEITEDLSGQEDPQLEQDSEQKANPESAASGQSSDTVENQSPFAPIRTVECREDLLQMADNWPFTLYGYSQFDLTTQPKVIATRMILESHDKQFISGLRTLRGYIPDAVINDYNQHLFGFGFGLKADALMPFVTKTYQSFINKKFKCDPLKKLQQQAGKFNPALFAGLASGMMNGLDGMSVIVMDFDGAFHFEDDNKKPEIRSIDGLVTVSAESPAMLALTANSLLKYTNFDIIIPMDGSVVEIPFPGPWKLKQKLKVTVKGNHIIAYMGDKAQQAAERLANEPLRANGMYTYSIDISAAMSFLESIMEKGDATKTMTEKEKRIQEAFVRPIVAAVAKMNAHYSEAYDVTPYGIVWDTKMSFD